MIVRPTRREMLRYGAAAAAAALPAPAIAQAWPSKPIRIICTYPAGGLTDVFSRAYGEYVSQKTGQPVVVENKAGAAGAIGAEMVKAAPPDGCTLMFTNSTTMVQNKVLFKKLPYNPDKDFALVAWFNTGHRLEAVADPLVDGEQVVRHRAPGDGGVAHAAEIGLAADDDRYKNRVLGKFVVGAAEEAVNLAAEGRQLTVRRPIVCQRLQCLEFGVPAVGLVLCGLRRLVDLPGERQGLVRHLGAVHVLAEPVDHLEDVAEADDDPALPLPAATPPGREGELDRTVLVGLDDKGRHAGNFPGIARRLDAEREGLGVLDNRRSGNGVCSACGRRIEEDEVLAACRSPDGLGHVERASAKAVQGDRAVIIH